MTSTATHPIPDDASGVIGALRETQTSVNDLEVRKLTLAVAWAAMHSTDSLMPAVADWVEQPVVVAGPGAPEVAEFCVPELARALGMSHDGAAMFLGESVELAYRLPRTYARVLAGDLVAWRGRRTARSTMTLSLEAVAFVDANVAPFAHKLGPVAVERLVEEAMVRFDPEAAEAKRLAAAEQRKFDIDLQHVTHDGVAWVGGCLDVADARDLEHAVQVAAADLAALGSTESLDVRRSQAVGVLARRQLTLDLNAPGETTVKARQVVIHVHAAPDGTMTVEGGGSLSPEQVRAWCTNPDTQVVIKPVIDLNATETTDRWAVPDRMREQVVLRDRTCVFPLCNVNARRCDLDHTQPWHDGGPTTPANLAPLCRRHHRLKTHGGWTYQRLPDGDVEWTSRHRQP
jgi:hypothetical protein